MRLVVLREKEEEESWIQDRDGYLLDSGRKACGPARLAHGKFKGDEGERCGSHSGPSTPRLGFGAWSRNGEPPKASRPGRVLGKSV